MKVYADAGGRVRPAKSGPRTNSPIAGCFRENWLEVRYVHCDGSPVAGARYRFEADNFSASGVLDDDGFTHVDDIPVTIASVRLTLEDDPEVYVPRQPSVLTTSSESENALESEIAALGNWLWGTVQGDFNQEPSLSQIAVNTIVGLIPIADQVLDLRDLMAGITHVLSYYTETHEEREAHQPSLGLSYETWLWISLFLIALGCIPVVGTAIKGILKALVKTLQDMGSVTGGLSAAQLRQIWEHLMRVLNHLGERQGNAHRWLKELVSDLEGHMDTAAGYIRTTAMTLRRYLADAAIHIRRLGYLPGIDARVLRQTLDKIESTYHTIDELLSSLEHQKRIIGQWFRENLNRILGGRGSSQGLGSVNTHPPQITGDGVQQPGLNRVSQQAEPPGEPRLPPRPLGPNIRELNTDPRRVSDPEFMRRAQELALEDGVGKTRIYEGIGAARFEEASGRRLVRPQPPNPRVDYIDEELGRVDLKGPIRRNDGSPFPFGDSHVEQLGNKVIEEANRVGDDVSESVIVDTLDMSDAQVDALRRQVTNAVSTDKPIIFLR